MVAVVAAATAITTSIYNRHATIHLDAAQARTFDATIASHTHTHTQIHMKKYQQSENVTERTVRWYSCFSLNVDSFFGAAAVFVDVFHQNALAKHEW